MSAIIFKSIDYCNSDALENIVAYALRVEKDELDETNYSILWGGRGVLQKTPRTAIKSFNAVKSIYERTGGNLLHHIIIDVHMDNIPRMELTYKVYKMAANLGANMAQFGYQNMYFIHNNNEGVHAHFIMNSINYLNGNRIPRTMTIGNYINNFMKEKYPECRWHYCPIYKNDRYDTWGY